MYSLLFGIATAVAVQIPDRYGRRENIIRGLKKEAIKGFRKNSRIDERALSDLVELGKQCEPGRDRELVLLALNELTDQVCHDSHYQYGTLETLIDDLVVMLTSQPRPEDFQNFRTAIGILVNIVTSNDSPGAEKKLVDRQHAVRALSALEQTALEQFGVSIWLDHILMEFVQALGLAADHFPAMATDVSQALFEVGALALGKKQTLIAIAALDKLLSLGQQNSPLKGQLAADLLGLAAHFWAGEGSPKEFIIGRLPLLKGCLAQPLPRALDAAREYCMMTMQFETADRLGEMAHGIRAAKKK